MNRMWNKTAAVAGLLWVSCLMPGGLAGEPKATGREPSQPLRGPDCVYVPTPYDVVEKMLDLGAIRKTDVVFDLGCGDGRVVVQAARKRGCRGVGFEIVPELVAAARQNARRNEVNHLVEIRQADLFQVDFQEATLVPMYLLPGMIVKLKPKLAELRPGTRIVAHDYNIEGVIPDKVVTMTSKETNVEHILYVYTVPLREGKSEDP